jgi:hypothetical protein
MWRGGRRSRRDLEHQLGSSSFAAAVLERLGAVPVGVAIRSQHRRAVGGMLVAVGRLAAAEPEFPADAVG